MPESTSLEKYFTQFGKGLDGMAYMIQRNDVHLSAMLYRGISKPSELATAPALAVSA